MKYVLVTGGVVSGLGKGVTASSIGVLLKACGHRVTSIKIGEPSLATRQVHHHNMLINHIAVINKHPATRWTPCSTPQLSPPSQPP